MEYSTKRGEIKEIFIRIYMYIMWLFMYKKW